MHITIPGMKPMTHRGLTVLANSELITRLRYRLGSCKNFLLPSPIFFKVMKIFVPIFCCDGVDGEAMERRPQVNINSERMEELAGGLASDRAMSRAGAGGRILFFKQQ